MPCVDSNARRPATSLVQSTAVPSTLLSRGGNCISQRLLALALLAISALPSLAAELTQPLSPPEAQQAMVLADASLKIELAAAEPDVIDPVAIRFDEDGRMWVVQMSDYPLGNPTGGEPLSKIRVLEDKDGDGRFEMATTFADKLLFATGLQPWKGGVFVTSSGKLTYMKDTDGDGRADVNELWFEGFAEQNSQLRANHPRLALDNWIYVANGLRGGAVLNRKLGDDKPINISGMDFRFDPLTGKCEAVSGNGQFGMAFDDWGNRFICSNRNPVKHVVIEDRYLKANPSVTVPATVNDVAAHGEASRIFPISRAWTTSNLHAGQFTAACGVYIYRGDGLPAEFQGNAFTCDPTGNLIHREIMEPAGPTFTSKPAYEGKEFLASKDEWFRPVNMELGPDGALYVVDMYRCVIEHPDFVPDELKKRPDLRLGDDRGRIWRIVPKVGADRRTGPSASETPSNANADTNRKRQRGKSTPPFSKTSSEDLVALLEHPNAWQRETAQRLLLARGDAPVAGLESFVQGSKSPLGRVHALWSLTGRGALQISSAEKALHDDFSLVRAHAIRAAESARLAESLGQQILNLVSDRQDVVRFQARLTAALERGRASPPGMTVDVDDPWLRRSTLLYCPPESATFALVSAMADSLVTPAKAEVGNWLKGIEDFAEFAAASDARVKETIEIGSYLTESRMDAGLAALRGASRAWARNGRTKRVFPELPVDTILEIARRETSPMSRRTSAIALLAYESKTTDSLVLLLSREQPQPIRLAAITALTRQPNAKPWEVLIGGFPSDTPPIRRAIIDGLLANPERTNLLLDAIEAGQIKPSEIDLAQVKRLIAHRDAKIKDRAGKLLAAATPADRAKALADYQPVLAMKGDAAKGQVIFEKNCSACHRIAGIGTTVAPDISDSRTKKYDQLLTDILQPNRAIDNNYLGYTVRTLAGEVLTGILTAETATSITLRQQGGKDAVIPRSEIDELKSSGVSLMPEGLERNIPPAEMADLLAFIKNWRYLDGRTPLGEQ